MDWPSHDDDKPQEAGDVSGLLNIVRTSAGILKLEHCNTMMNVVYLLLPHFDLAQTRSKFFEIEDFELGSDVLSF